MHVYWITTWKKFNSFSFKQEILKSIKVTHKNHILPSDDKRSFVCIFRLFIYPVCNNAYETCSQVNPNPCSLCRADISHPTIKVTSDWLVCSIVCGPELMFCMLCTCVWQNMNVKNWNIKHIIQLSIAQSQQPRGIDHTELFPVPKKKSGLLTIQALTNV